MGALNLLILILNVLGLISVLRYHTYKRDQLREQLKQVQESLHPALFRDKIMQTQCCIICHGNTPNKPAGYPRQVSAHDLCLNRFKAGEVQVKRVGQSGSKKQINLKKELALSIEQENIKLIPTKGIL